MSIKSIIIDKATKATRIDNQKVQLEITAFPIDEENNTEPNSELRLYINSQLLQTIKSDEEGKIKESLVINDSENEQILVKIEDIAEGVQSKIKCVFIEETKEKETTNKKEKNLYKLHKDIISEFNIIDRYFQELVKPENKYDEKFIEEEFDKIKQLAKLKHQIKKSKELEFYEVYKNKLDKMISYCKKEMTIFEIENSIKDIEEIIRQHNDNFNLLNIKKTAEEKGSKSDDEDRKKTEENNKKEEEKKREKILDTIKQNPQMFCPLNVSSRLLPTDINSMYKNDEEIARTAISQYPELFQYAGDNLKTNEDFVIKCIKKYGYEKIGEYLSIYTKGLPKIKEEKTKKQQELVKELAKLKEEKARIKEKLDTNSKKISNGHKIENIKYQYEIREAIIEAGIDEILSYYNNLNNNIVEKRKKGETTYNKRGEIHKIEDSKKTVEESIKLYGKQLNLGNIESIEDLQKCREDLYEKHKEISKEYAAKNNKITEIENILKKIQ